MTTQSDASVLLDVTGGVGWITLNRPKAYNALNTDMAERLLDAVIRCDEDDKIRAVVITGNGASFCAGGDIRQMIDSSASEGNAALFLKTLTVSLHAAIATIAYMSTRCFRRRSSSWGRRNSPTNSPAGRPPRSGMPSGS